MNPNIMFITWLICSLITRVQGEHISPNSSLWEVLGLSQTIITWVPGLHHRLTLVLGGHCNEAPHNGYVQGWITPSVTPICRCLRERLALHDIVMVMWGCSQTVHFWETNFTKWGQQKCPFLWVQRRLLVRGSKYITRMRRSNGGIAAVCSRSGVLSMEGPFYSTVATENLLVKFRIFWASTHTMWTWILQCELLLQQTDQTKHFSLVGN